MVKEIKRFVVTEGDLPTVYDIYRLCERAKNEKFIGLLEYDFGKIFKAEGVGDWEKWAKMFVDEYGEKIKKGSKDDYK